MDTIAAFLDAMFAPYPATPRLTEAKAELRAMMEDAYADAIGSGKTHNEAVGQVITDFGNLEELAPALGILPDIRGVQEATPPSTPTAPAAAAPSGPPVVTLPEAQALAEAKRTTGRALGTGVAVLVLAAAPFIALTGMAEGSGPFAVSERQAELIGLPLTLVIVAAGVLILVQRRQAFVGLTHLLNGQFTQDPIVSAWARRLRVEHDGPRSRALMAAVGLWIVSAIPVVSTGALSDMDGYSGYSSLGVVGTLLLVALGLWIFLPTNWAASTHTALTEQGRPSNATEDWKDGAELIGIIAAAYWPLAVLVYLVWSFGFNAWDKSWIIWPIAGVLFGSIAGVTESMAHARRKRQR